jgi:hypothetical protein
MARFLRVLGLTIIAAAVILLIAGEAGAASRDLVDDLFVPGLQAGAVALLAGLALSLLAPFGRMATQGRCVRCGARIEKGQTYCHDHLRRAVQEFQDQTRGGS